MTKDLLIRFLDNRCTSQELEEIVQWFNDDSMSDEGKSLIFNDWKSFRLKENLAVDEEKFGSLLDKIHHKINLAQQLRNNKIRTFSPIITWLTRAAAILLIPVLTILLYTISGDSFNSSKFTDNVVDSLEIVAPIGSRTVVQLSDGTEVNLNYGSKIKYPRTFSKKTRELTLIGEGYFKVAHNPRKPFIVKTTHLSVKALGTKFNVKAYPDDKLVSTTLVEGKVVLEKFDQNGKGRTIGAMEPGQHVDYGIKTGKISSTMGNLNKYIGWKDGLLIFDNSSIVEVADRLGRMFNVDIQIADEIREYTYTVTFIDEPLSQILDLMTEATPIKYKILPRRKLPNGTFSRQKILLQKK